MAHVSHLRDPTPQQATAIPVSTRSLTFNELSPASQLTTEKSSSQDNRNSSWRSPRRTPICPSISLFGIGTKRLAILAAKVSAWGSHQSL